jgi:ABC-type uncharacterized transport system substrate-binding protein
MKAGGGLAEKERKKKEKTEKEKEQRKKLRKERHGSGSDHSYFSEVSDGGTRHVKRKKKIKDAHGNVIGYGDEYPTKSLIFTFSFDNTMPCN